MVNELKQGVGVGSTFNRGMEVYKKNFVPLLVATLLAVVIGGITCGICAAPLFCGLFAMILTALRNKEATLRIGDVFKGFQRFLPAFVSCLVIGAVNSIVCSILAVVPILGWIAIIVIGYAALPAVVLWAQLLVTDQNASIGDAILVPLKLLGDKRFWSVVLVAFVACLLGSLGAIACGIGIFVTLPFAYCMVAAAYEEAYAGGAPAVAEPVAAAPEAPAADETPAS